MGRYFDKVPKKVSKNVPSKKVEKKISKVGEKGAKRKKNIKKFKSEVQFDNDVSKKKEKRKLFKDRDPVPKEKFEKHSRGKEVDVTFVRSKLHKQQISEREKVIKYASEQAARSELLLLETGGFLVPDEGEETRQYTQSQIASNVDITSCTKYFNLELRKFGPYRMNYSRNGRYLLLGGRKSHIAAIDWLTKRLLCEINVMDSVYDVSWLHIETMFAVAQKDWVFIYDNTGIELHCIKKLYKVIQMEFLPYHFLLATASENGYLSWLDVSIGKMVANFNTLFGRLNMMTQNPWNAVLCLGHPKGVVSMWSPNVNKPLVKMLCHPHPIHALAVDHRGQYMATSSVDRGLRLWDVRMLDGPVQDYKLKYAASSLAFSQKGLLATGVGNIVEIYHDPVSKVVDTAYLQHRLSSTVTNVQFCPFEDVLGIGSYEGFSSILVPGSGEPNFDGLESNPYQTKSQRKESEVKSLLDKIQPEMITLDPEAITEIDLPTLKDKYEEKKKFLYLKPSKIDFEPRKRAKKKKGSLHSTKVKKIVREEGRKEFVKAYKNIVTSSEVFETNQPESSATNSPYDVLKRFNQKKS